MTVPNELPEAPQRFVIRHARTGDAAEIARVHVASWETFYRGILPDELIRSRTFDVRKKTWATCVKQSDRLTLVAARPDDTIAGFASALLLNRADDAFDAYLQTLYLEPGSTGGGTGSRLIRALANELVQRGKRSMILRVLRLNRARKFYENLGARIEPTDFRIDSGTFDDVTYVFDDLERLARPL